MLVVGIVLLVISAVLGLGSVRLLSQANRTTPMPWWINPPNRPTRSLVLRSIGAGLGVLACSATAPSIGFWAVLLFLLGQVPQLVIIVQHNRRVAALTQP